MRRSDDKCPGAHSAYRRDLLTKLVSFAPTGEKIFFGTDKYVEEYPSDIVRGWLDFEKQVLDEAGATDEFRENMYSRNMFAFLGRERQA